MNVSIFGLGYVGTVSAACMARDGHSVIGVDAQASKVEAMNRGQSTIIEPSLEELLLEGVRADRVTATTNVCHAVKNSDVSLISVGTPPSAGGGPDLSFVDTVCLEIGRAVRAKGEAHVVVLRSTVPPGTLERCRSLLEDTAGEIPVHVAFNPEFLREGSAVRDYIEPPYTIIGTEDPQAEATVRELYANVTAPIIVVKAEVAEMIKYVANAWHATKIGFANEVGRVAHGFGVDGREVMQIIAADTKLNVSPAYMRPGFAYGGSCLPKDLNSMLHYAQVHNVSVPLLGALPQSNRTMIDEALAEALATNTKRITVLGLAFKPNTDDLRESPAVPLVKHLLGEGKTLTIYDAAVNEATLLGSNLSFIERNLPHFSQLLKPALEEALDGAELVIATYGSRDFAEALRKLPEGTKVLDLAGVFAAGEVPRGLDYHALCW